jgi:predicted site-specific integrase-resolvase
MVEDGLITTNEVCELLNINHNNLHQINYRGQIKWMKKDGRKVYYNREDVMAYKIKRDKRGKKAE